MKHPGFEAWNAGLDRGLFFLSAYAIPLAIALFSIVALIAWVPQYPTETHAKVVPFRVAEDVGGRWDLAAAQAALRDQPEVSFTDNRLSESPYWFVFKALPAPEATHPVIEFASRHTMETTCWNSGSGEVLGQANRRDTSGAISPVKAGFQLELTTPTPAGIVCKARFVGPARLSVLQWSEAGLAAATQEFHHNAGLLDGGLIVLALFVFITALINRNSTYILFSAWLVVNLRMAALSAGWDHQWLGRTIPYDLLLQGRLVTITLYYVLTLSLFTTLFKDDLEVVGHRRVVDVARWSCPPLLLLSFFLSYPIFLPLMWVTTGVGVAMLVYLMGHILHKSRSQVAIWYSASIAVALFASLYEVISASLGFKGLIGAVNSVTAALASSLMASLAIAAQMKQEHDQRLEIQAELQHTYEAMPIGLFTLDMQGRFVSTNPALRNMLGQQVQDDGQNDWFRFFRQGAWTRLHQLVNTQSDAELEIEGLPDAQGNEPRRYMVKATLARDRIEGSLQDVTEKSRANEHLQFLAHNDPLTKVLNRRGVEKALDAAMASARQGKPLALAYLDLDRFKLINDLFGHSAGDEVLQQVCARVGAMLSGSMSLGRVGGDEFVIVMPDTRVALAGLLCQSIVSSIGQTPYRVGERAFHVRGSIGLIEVAPSTSTKDAVSTADRACREAKSNNSGLVVFEKNARVFLEHEAELKLVEHLSAHAEIEGLFLEMQPIMSLTAPTESLNFEVLLRMLDANGERIPTDRLISAGENSGRMGVIDRWVLSNTVQWLSRHKKHLKNTQFVCMNLSGASLNDEKFIQDVFSTLEENIHIAKHLCLEITESVALHDLQNTRRFIDQVRQYGAKVALDDFGAGYTSFSYLKDLPGDLLKIDGSFIVNMNQHPANIAIVEAIVSLARNLGMKTIAEWAEDCATVQTLVEIGVDYVQGFVVARPQHPDLLLQAVSSASFIRDPALQAFVKNLQPQVFEIGQNDLFTGNSPASNLH
ncbi:EAL domain-containing protein [Hydrogenophaga sp. OTU3427]|uniref:EAL domain-containing protein n=1 Tax=Hydrogenophaga sp. OTU3427 TaxID=3043856 RepID=UPI00313AAE55